MKTKSIFTHLETRANIDVFSDACGCNLIYLKWDLWMFTFCGQRRFRGLDPLNYVRSQRSIPYPLMHVTIHSTPKLQYIRLRTLTFRLKAFNYIIELPRLLAPRLNSRGIR